MKFTTKLAIFVTTFLISSNFQITAQVLNSTVDAETLINSTLENAPSTEPQPTSAVSNQRPMSTANSTDEPQFSTSISSTAKQAAASNLPPLPPSQLSTSNSTTSATDSYSSMWSHSPSTPPEQTTSQITNQTDHQVTSWQNNVTNSSFQLELDSTPGDPSNNTTQTPNDTLIASTSDAPINSTEENENGTGTSFQVVDNNSTTEPIGDSNATSENNNNTEIELNVTSVPESVSESVSANGTSPATRNSTERFSDVDATPLHETASMTSSSSVRPVPSVTSTSEPETSTSKPRAASKKWFMLQFMGNCTEMEHKFEDFKKQIHDKILSKAGIPDHQVTLNAINCTNSFLMNVSVSPESEGQLTQFFSNLESTTNSSNKFRISDETYLLNVVNYLGDNAYHQPPEVTLSSKHTDIEFVIYVALGSACVFLLSLAVILVACKYCRSKPYKSFDLNDISHLSLGLEDFTLTRIPRPKSTSIYNDFGNNKNQYSPIDQQGGGNGMVHSYDTSVVPLEDAPNFKSDNETEPRIVGKSTQTSPTNHEYEEIDVKAVKSTENLHSAPKPAPKHWGVDNASFSTP